MDKQLKEAAAATTADKAQLIDILIKQGKVSLNQARLLSGLNPVNDPQFDQPLRKDK